MVSKKADIEARKDRILTVTIEEYIKTVSPVSSAYITEKYFYDLSSATVRNILADLENGGLLTHPHTSAGRVPTDKGYRYYVDNLMDEIQLLEEEQRRIRREYQQEKHELERLLEKTSRMLSNETNYTSIVSVNGSDKFYCFGRNFVVDYPESRDLQKIEAILSALEEKEKMLNLIDVELDKRVDVYIGHEIKAREMEQCSLVLTEFHSPGGISGRVAVLGPTRMDYERVVSAVEYFSKLIEEVL